MNNHPVVLFQGIMKERGESLADLLRSVKLTRQTWSNWLRGKLGISPRKIILLANHFNIDPISLGRMHSDWAIEREIERLKKCQ